MYTMFADNAPLHNLLNDTAFVLEPKLTVEMGKAGALTFSLLPTHPLYSQLQKLKTVVTVKSGSREIFRGRVLDADKALNNSKTVYCEGNLAYLVDSQQPGVAFTGTVHQLFSALLAAHNARVEASKQFLLGNITVEDRPIVISGQSDDVQDLETGNFDYRQIVINSIVNEWKTSLDYFQYCLIDYAGGYLRTRKESNGVYLDYLADYGTTATQEIKYGENLLDFLEETAIEDLFTVLVPLGDDNLTIASVNGGSDELVDEEAVALYGRIMQTHVFSNVSSAATLLENGQRFLDNRDNLPTGMTINAVDLHNINPDIDEFFCGDTVHISSIPNGLSVDLPCRKIEYDLSNPAYTVYTFGRVKQSLTERYRQDITETQDSISGATGSAARGGGGGAAAVADELKEFKAWIDFDPTIPMISLKVMNSLTDKLENVVTDTLGLDINGSDGSEVNLYNMRSAVDTNSQDVYEQAAQIVLLQHDLDTEIQLSASRADYLDDRESTHFASLDLRASNLEAEIALKVTSEVEGLHYAELTLKANNNASAIALKADSVTLDAVETNLNGQILNINSEILNINADIVNVENLIAQEINAMKGDISWLSSKVISCNSVNCTSVSASQVSASYLFMGGSTVATQAWVLSQLASLTLAWDKITGKPGSYPAAAHNHYFYDTYSLSWGHYHPGTAGVVNYSNKTIEIGGNTGYN